MSDELSTEARAVLDAGMRAMTPTAADKARVRAALDARLTAGSAVPQGTPVVVVLGVLLAIAIAWWATHRPVRRPPATPQPVTEVRTAEAPPTPAPPVVEQRPAPPPPPPVPPVPPTPRPAVPRRPGEEDTLAAEMLLIGQARRAHAEGNDADAFRAFAEHRQRYPRGQMVEEREASELVIRCQRGDADVQTRRQAFARRFPGSVQQAHIDRVCSEPRPQ